MSHEPESTRLLTALHRTATVLDSLGQSWALVGGLAISVRVEPRFTRDIDLAVAVADDLAAEALVGEFTARGFTLRVSLEQAALHRLAAVRILPPGEPDSGVIIDLLFMSSGVEPEICGAAEKLEVAPGLVVPVALAGPQHVADAADRDDQRRVRTELAPQVADVDVERAIFGIGLGAGLEGNVGDVIHGDRFLEVRSSYFSLQFGQAGRT